MSQENEKQPRFLGTYFDANSVISIAHWANIFAWVILVVYLLVWLVAMFQILFHFFNGLIFDKGMVFLNILNIFTPYLLQPLPGFFYFIALQAVGKGLLILMDMEENTRRAARK